MGNTHIQPKRRSAGIAWLFQMAWRESRRNLSRLFLFMSSIIIGIAALVSVQSLSQNLKREADLQAAELLGADVAANTNREFSPEMKSLLDSIGDRHSRQSSFSSMAFFPASGQSRFVQIRAIEGDYPYYGKLQTEPAEAGNQFRSHQGALVDKALLFRFKASVGDSIRLGELSFRIDGALLSAPGQNGISTLVAPIVFIPGRFLPQTGLAQKGSRIRYSHFIKFNQEADVEGLITSLRPRFDREKLDIDTVESQKNETSRTFSDLTRFLSIIGFVALLLGCVGVASAVHILIREKTATIAMLRCLGASYRQAFLIQLIQVTAVGLLGAAMGVLLGIALQFGFPSILRDLLPFTLRITTSPLSVFQGLATGLAISVLFSLAPMVSIRNVSPLHTLRVGTPAVKGIDWMKVFIYLLIGAFVLGFSYLLLRSGRYALYFSVGVAASFAILWGMSLLLMKAVRRFFPASWPYVWRQGLANLYRPNNQTAVIVLSVGFGTALVCTVFLIRQTLLDRLTLSTSGGQPNMAVFDIGTPQLEGVRSEARRLGIQYAGSVPVVTMRVASVGYKHNEGLKDTTALKDRWLFRNEFRATYRDSIAYTERIVDGEWTGRWEGGDDPIPVSWDRRIAANNKLRVGDTVVFNVQGMPLKTIVGSLRDIEWRRLSTNFFLVFPTGVLEKAPQIHALLTRAPDMEKSAAFQEAVVRKFPNVSVIDLGMVIDVLDTIFSRIGTVISFMAMFCICTGIVVLLSSVLISRYQRMREGVLLRTLGANRRQVFAITALEYFFLGALASLVGVGISMAAGWSLAHFLFESPFRPNPMMALLAVGSVCAITVGIGLANSRFVVNKPPLEVLREE